LRSIPFWRTIQLFTYAIEISFSEDDERYIAIVPELPGGSAFGETEEALRDVKIARQLRIAPAKKERRTLPRPMGNELLQQSIGENEQSTALS
jgi:predicted RNase H-like HicB family nuclease